MDVLSVSSPGVRYETIIQYYRQLKEELQINLDTELILLLQTKLERYGSNNPKYISTDSIVIARNPNKYREYEESSIGHIYGAGSKKYIYSKQI